MIDQSKILPGLQMGQTDSLQIEITEVTHNIQGLIDEIRAKITAVPSCLTQSFALDEEVVFVPGKEIFQLQDSSKPWFVIHQPKDSGQPIFEHYR